MTAALEGGEWSAARPGRTSPLGKTRYPFCRRLGGTQGRSGQAENLVPTGIRSRTVQPVVSRYTDWATRPTVNTNKDFQNTGRDNINCIFFQHWTVGRCCELWRKPPKLELTNSTQRSPSLKANISQLVKKFPAFYGTRKLINRFYNTHPLSLSTADQSSPCPHPTSWTSIVILFSHLRLGLPSHLFPPGFPTKPLLTPTHVTCLANLIIWSP